MAQIALPDAVPHGRDMAHISSFQMQARGIDGTNRFDRHKLHGTDGTDHLSRRKLAAQMAQITLPDKQPWRRWHRSISSSQHRWHRSTCTTEARDTDGTGHLFRRKLAAQMAYIALLDTSFTPYMAQITLPDTSSMTQMARIALADITSRHRCHRSSQASRRKCILPDASSTAQTDHYSRRKLAAQIAQITPRRTLHGTDRLARQKLRGTDGLDHFPSHKFHGAYGTDHPPMKLEFRSVKCAPSHCQTYPRQRRRRSSQATRGRWHRSSCQTQASRHRWHRSPC